MASLGDDSHRNILGRLPGKYLLRSGYVSKHRYSIASVCDNILGNILSRLRGKSLLRCRCVSKHWNAIISDPSFMKLRSRSRMVLLPFPRPMVAIDDEAGYEVLLNHSPLEHEDEEIRFVSAVGTFNGIVLLALSALKSLRCHLVLYNPLTCASKKLVVMDPPSIGHKGRRYVFGFGYGATIDELKIVRLEAFESVGSMYRYQWDVFDLKTSSWSTKQQYLESVFIIPGSDAGMFLNGCLYWSTSTTFGILALDLKEMVISRIERPGAFHYIVAPVLGSIDGCLCMVDIRYDFWVMKEQGQWLKARSFSVHPGFRSLCVLGNGKILLKGNFMQLFMYDPSEDSCKRLGHLLKYGQVSLSDSVFIWTDLRCTEYVESLVLPSDI